MQMTKMPFLFVGHGSPMNAVEDNIFTSDWRRIGKLLPEPQAVLVISAHWYTRGTRITGQSLPPMIYDMFGFPNYLYQIKYPTTNVDAWVSKTLELFDFPVLKDQEWGIDHGAWSVLNQMFPEGGFPVYQLSIDRTLSMDEQFKIGRKLSGLREQGVLIIGSGNIVHNLSLLDWHTNLGFEWAKQFDDYIADRILKRDYHRVLQYESAGPSAKKAFTTLEHFLPLVYILGLVDATDEVTIFNHGCTLGSISMTSYLFVDKPNSLR